MRVTWMLRFLKTKQTIRVGAWKIGVDRKFIW